MTTVSITPAEDGVTIQLFGVGADRAMLLDTFAGCADGTCACSSDEYGKVQSMDVQSDGDAITISVTAFPGQTIDPSCISECVDVTERSCDYR